MVFDESSYRVDRTSPLEMKALLPLVSLCAGLLTACSLIDGAHVHEDRVGLFRVTLPSGWSPTAAGFSASTGGASPTLACTVTVLPRGQASFDRLAEAVRTGIFPGRTTSEGTYARVAVGQGGHPAIRSDHSGARSYSLLNPRGDLVTFGFRRWTPEVEAAALLGSLQWMATDPIPPGTSFEANAELDPLVPKEGSGEDEDLGTVLRRREVLIQRLTTTAGVLVGLGGLLLVALYWRRTRARAPQRPADAPVHSAGPVRSAARPPRIGDGVPLWFALLYPLTTLALGRLIYVAEGRGESLIGPGILSTVVTWWLLIAGAVVMTVGAFVRTFIRLQANDAQRLSHSILVVALSLALYAPLALLVVKIGVIP